MKEAIKKNPSLWKRIVAKVKRQDKYGESNSWNARKAQYAVKLYKEKGGKYEGEKAKDNSLVKWTKQKWRYSSVDKGRYLPDKVWEKLSPQEKAATNRKKKMAIKAHQKKAKYSEKIARLVRKA